VIPADLLGRLNRDVERSALRARNGIRYVSGARPANVGATPKDVVWRRDKAELWRYHGGSRRFETPLLIVHSLVSRSYILDLRPGNSLVEFLKDFGFDVFLLDWGVPDELDAENTLETYVDEYLPRAVDAVRRETGADELTMMGYCLGGVIATLYASAYADARVRNLMLLATPFDFDAMGAMVAPLREGRLDADDLIDDTGNVPADALYSGFFMQAPTVQVAQHATLWENLWNDEFVEGYQAMAQWSRDHVPFPGAAFTELVERLVRRNELMSGHMRLGNRDVDLSRARCHVVNAIAERDGVVPPAASEPATRLVGDPARREELRVPGGHVTFATGRQAIEHTMPRLAEWIAAHSDERSTAGSRRASPLRPDGQGVTPLVLQ
jgi:poly[(R)-3-hydroxyalkanoate] polymerase subunit PhaC